jgi:hypothetical protein
LSGLGCAFAVGRFFFFGHDWVPLIRVIAYLGLLLAAIKRTVSVRVFGRGDQ